MHIDAFRADSLAYIQAIGWRLRGLKVRSRNRIAPLAGRSPHAYSLWVAQQNTRRSSNWAAEVEVDILPVVDCRFGGDIDHTLASIAAAQCAVQPILIGGSPRPGTRRVDLPQQLSSLLPAQGQWLCPMPAGDLLDATAFRAYAKAIDAVPQSTVFYADDDLVGEDGTRREPHFKPQWNYDLFAHHDYLTGACVIFSNPETILDLSDQWWVEALLDRALATGSNPAHVPLVLHHRRFRPQPSIPARPAEPISEPPTVSAVIPTRNHEQLLRNCVEGVEKTDYPNVEILIIDNGSDDPSTLGYLEQLEARGHRVLRRPGPFNYSALNNDAVRHASGAMLCFLNNDVEMVDRDWLTLLVRQAIRREIGAVGAMLLYPDRTIQHAGVYLGIGGGAGHAHRFLSEDDAGYFDRARLPQLVSAVTAACMVVDRAKFLAVGGFDEQLFPVAFNDVDLCLMLNGRGWQSFYEPRARLIHHESKSRGSDRAKGNRVRFAGELAALKAKWSTDRGCDPFHHPELSPYSEQFVVAV